MQPDDMRCLEPKGTRMQAIHHPTGGPIPEGVAGIGGFDKHSKPQAIGYTHSALRIHCGRLRPLRGKRTGTAENHYRQQEDEQSSAFHGGVSDITERLQMALCYNREEKYVNRQTTRRIQEGDRVIPGPFVSIRTNLALGQDPG
jgi:hypothetical protein